MTNQSAPTKEKALMALLKSDTVKDRFIETVGPGGGAWITAIINAANLNPKIWDCDPVSVVTAGLNAAVLRLSVDPSTSQAAIVPFGKGAKAKAVFIPMARGIKQLALRTDKYRYINTTPVFEGEEIEEDRNTGIKHIRGRATSKKAIGYYAAFALFSGYEATLYMTIEEIENHGMQYSPSYDRRNQRFYPGSMWLENFPIMANKTVLKLLLLRDGILETGSRNVLESLESDQNEPSDFERDLENIIDGDLEEVDQTEEAEIFDESGNLLELGIT